MRDILQCLEAVAVVSATILGLACSAAARADDVPAVTPYRPSVSTPATLSAPGWLEFEAGLFGSRGIDPARRDSLPYTVKLAFTPDWGLRIGGDALVHQRNADDTSLHGGGDTTIVLKRRFAVNDASAFGLEIGTKLPTAAKGLGSGQADVGVNGIYSADFPNQWHTDINLSANRLGSAAADVSRWQTGWAVALSRSMTEAWGLVAELSGTHQHGAGHTTQALAAASYAVSSRLNVDLGLSKGLTAASGGWSVFTGFTVLGPRLF